MDLWYSFPIKMCSCFCSPWMSFLIWSQENFNYAFPGQFPGYGNKQFGYSPIDAQVQEAQVKEIQNSAI